MKGSLIAASFALALICRGQGSLVIGFDEPPVPEPGSGSIADVYSEAGMQFTLLGDYLQGTGILRLRGGYYSWPDSGSAYMVGPPLVTNTLSFHFADNSIFSLVSVDLAEHTSVPPEAAIVQFVGYRLDGSTVTSEFTTDGFNDGPGGLPDFETFYFGSDFRDLERVEMPTHGWTLDNLVVVPEPAAGALLIVGGLLAGGLRRFVARRAERRRSTDGP